MREGTPVRFVFNRLFRPLRPHSPITIEMVAVDVGIVASAFRNVHFSSDREIVFQPEQESA